MKDEVQKILGNVLKMFESGNLPEAVAKTVIKAKIGETKPCNNWSLANQVIMLAAGTEDARSYKQWQSVKRQVKKHAKAIYIFAPCTKKIVNDGTTGEETAKTILTGFKPLPVFRIEDTEGEPLPEINHEPAELPPLYDLAEKFAIKVSYKPFYDQAYGEYTLSENKITLRSHDANIFFHELAHAVHNTFKRLKSGQHADQEIVAEIVGCTLCEIYGHKGYIWHGFEYIKHYAGQDTMQALKAVMGVLKDVQRILDLIFEAKEAKAELKAG